MIRRIPVPTLYLTQEQALVRRDGEDCLLVQIPERRAKDGVAPSTARKERVPLIKIDEVVVLGEVTLTASAMHLLLERNIEITWFQPLRPVQRSVVTFLLKECRFADSTVPGPSR
jgi:CRISPR-associated protein Cas1